MTQSQAWVRDEDPSLSEALLAVIHSISNGWCPRLLVWVLIKCKSR